MQLKKKKERKKERKEEKKNGDKSSQQATVLFFMKELKYMYSLVVHNILGILMIWVWLSNHWTQNCYMYINNLFYSYNLRSRNYPYFSVEWVDVSSVRSLSFVKMEGCAQNINNTTVHTILKNRQVFPDC